MSDDNHTLPYPDAAAEHETLVIPGQNTAEAETPARPKRRRWPWVLLIVVVVLGLLVVAAEFIARAVLPGVVRSLVIDELNLPADQQLDVEADGILLPQLIGGSLDRLDIRSVDVTVVTLTPDDLDPADRRRVR